MHSYVPGVAVRHIFMLRSSLFILLRATVADFSEYLNMFID